MIDWVTRGGTREGIGGMVGVQWLSRQEENRDRGMFSVNIWQD